MSSGPEGPKALVFICPPDRPLVWGSPFFGPPPLVWALLSRTRASAWTAGVSLQAAGRAEVVVIHRLHFRNPVLPSRFWSPVSLFLTFGSSTGESQGRRERGHRHKWCSLLASTWARSAALVHSVCTDRGSPADSSTHVLASMLRLGFAALLSALALEMSSSAKLLQRLPCLTMRPQC